MQHSIYLWNWRWHVNQKYSQNALLHFCYNIGYPNSPQCYVIYSLPVSLPYLLFRLANGGTRHGEESREPCLGHDWLETFIQNGFFGRPVVSLIVDEAHYTRYQKRKHRFPHLMYRTIDSCCRISCGLDCLPVDCAEQFGELCQESVATETATECKDELRMLHWFRTYGLCYCRL